MEPRQFSIDPEATNGLIVNTRTMIPSDSPKSSPANLEPIKSESSKLQADLGNGWFKVNQSGVVTISLADMKGRSVKKIYRKKVAPGHHTFSAHLGNLANGHYVLWLKTANTLLTHPITVGPPRSPVPRNNRTVRLVTRKGV